LVLGRFNVPIGSYLNPTILDKENILAVSKALKGVEIVNMPFADFCRKFAKKDDFIYFDPPYQPLSKTSNFTGYTKENFSLKDQERLRDLFDEMNSRGCKLMLSNSRRKSDTAKMPLNFSQVYRERKERLLSRNFRIVCKRRIIRARY
jgi:DNA adenine methylase